MFAVFLVVGVVVALSPVASIVLPEGADADFLRRANGTASVGSAGDGETALLRERDVRRQVLRPSAEAELARGREQRPQPHLTIGKGAEPAASVRDGLLTAGRSRQLEEARRSFAYRAAGVVSRMHQYFWIFGLLAAFGCVVVFVSNSPGSEERSEDCEQNWVLDAATRLRVAPRTPAADKADKAQKGEPRGSKLPVAAPVAAARVDLPRGSKVALGNTTDAEKLAAVLRAEQEKFAAEYEAAKFHRKDCCLYCTVFLEDLRWDRELQLAVIFISFLAFRFIVFSMAASTVLLGAAYPQIKEVTPSSDQYMNLVLEHGRVLLWGLLCGQLKQLLVVSVTPILFAVAATHWCFGFFFPIVCAEELYYVRFRRKLHKSPEVCMRFRTQLLMFVITLFFLTVPFLELVEFMVLTSWTQLQIARYVCLLVTYALSLRWVFTACAFQLWAIAVLLPLACWECFARFLAICHGSVSGEASALLQDSKPWSLSQSMCSRRVREGWDDRRVAVYDVTWFFYTNL